MGGPTPPIPFKLYQVHWDEKLQPYIDAGFLIASGVKCPEDGNELFVLEPVKAGIVIGSDQKPFVREQFAICANGHFHPL